MFGFGLTVAGIGMGIVFLELILLVFVIYAISKCAGLINEKKQSQGTKPVQVTAEPAPLAVSQEVPNDEDDILAVIAAALACCGQDAKRIASITRTKAAAAAAWSHAGRQDTMSLRQM